MKNVNYTGEEMYNITVIIITDKHKALIVRAAAHFIVYSLYLSIASQYIPFNAKKKKSLMLQKCMELRLTVSNRAIRESLTYSSDIYDRCHSHVGSHVKIKCISCSIYIFYCIQLHGMAQFSALLHIANPDIYHLEATMTLFWPLSHTGGPWIHLPYMP